MPRKRKLSEDGQRPSIISTKKGTPPTKKSKQSVADTPIINGGLTSTVCTDDHAAGATSDSSASNPAIRVAVQRVTCRKRKINAATIQSYFDAPSSECDSSDSEFQSDEECSSSSSSESDVSVEVRHRKRRKTQADVINSDRSNPVSDITDLPSCSSPIEDSSSAQPSTSTSTPQTVQSGERRKKKKSENEKGSAKPTYTELKPGETRAKDEQFDFTEQSGPRCNLTDESKPIDFFDLFSPSHFGL